LPPAVTSAQRSEEAPLPQSELSHTATAEQVRHSFDALFAETGLRLETSVTRIVMWGAAFVLLLALLGMAMGSTMPRAIPLVALAYFAWYFAIHALLKTGRFKPWLRYASCLVDVSLCGVVMLIDFDKHGSIYAAASGGPALYAVAVAMATLRLQPGLCLFAGSVAATQFIVIMLLVVRPAAPVNEAFVTSTRDVFVTLMKSFFLLTIGGVGWVATRSMRGMLLRLTESAVERERVRGVLGMHVSEQVMEYLLSGTMKDGGERRTITVCFTDIRDFTRLSESRAPEEVLRLLNLYFGRMCDIVAAHGGVVNKFLGDGMLVVFGAPAHQADDAQRAMAAAREMLAEVTRMRERGEFPDLHIGVGMHRGEAVVGNVGGQQRQEYTAIGDTVNTASRVQDLTKQLGRSLLLTRECVQALGGADFEPLGSHTVKGRVQALELFSAPEQPPGRDEAA
jgi:adenylate cyclase